MEFYAVCQGLIGLVLRRAIKLGRKPLMQQGSPKRNPESKAAFESNQKLAILEFARISKSQVFPSLIAVWLYDLLWWRVAAVLARMCPSEVLRVGSLCTGDLDALIGVGDLRHS